MRWLCLVLLVLVGCEPIPDEPDLAKEIEKITTLGYVAASERAPEQSGVLLHAPEAYEGYTLFTLRSEPTIMLIDMAGVEVRSWELPGYRYISRVRPHPYGGMVAITVDPPGMVRLAADGTTLWAVDDGIHHDLDIRKDGSIYALCHEMESHPQILDQPIVVDYIVQYDGNGREVRRHKAQPDAAIGYPLCQHSTPPSRAKPGVASSHSASGSQSARKIAFIAEARLLIDGIVSSVTARSTARC